MLRSRLALLLVLPVALLLMAFHQLPLVNPAPIAVPARITQPQVYTVITKVLARFGWVVASDKPGAIEATYAPRDFTVRIGITYDKDQVQIRYIDSTNLKYEVKKDGITYIHKNYTSWIRNLVNGINGEFNLL
jgi:hypothetical protein